MSCVGEHVRSQASLTLESTHLMWAQCLPNYPTLTTTIPLRCYGPSAYEFCMAHPMHGIHCLRDEWCAPPAVNKTQAMATAPHPLNYNVGIWNKMIWIEAILNLNVSVMWLVS